MPRGQVAYSLIPGLDYEYGPKITIKPTEACPQWLEDIFKDVNKMWGTNMNTCLINDYRNGKKDFIGLHHDNTTDWKDGSGFITLSFGANRPMKLELDYSQDKKTKEFLVPPAHKKVLQDEKYKFQYKLTRKIFHGYSLLVSSKANKYWRHAIPKKTNILRRRISITFREIDPQKRKNRLAEIARKKEEKKNLKLAKEAKKKEEKKKLRQAKQEQKQQKKRLTKTKVANQKTIRYGYPILSAVKLEHPVVAPKREKGGRNQQGMELFEVDVNGEKSKIPLINVKFPYPKFIFDKTKTEETRSYPLHEHIWFGEHMDTGIGICQTVSDKTITSQIKHKYKLPKVAMVVGVMKLDKQGCNTYDTQDKWKNAITKHVCNFNFEGEAYTDLQKWIGLVDQEKIQQQNENNNAQLTGLKRKVSVLELDKKKKKVRQKKNEIVRNILEFNKLSKEINHSEVLKLLPMEAKRRPDCDDDNCSVECLKYHKQQ